MLPPNPRRRALLFGACLVLLPAAACDGGQGPGDGLPTEIEVNRAVWEARRPARYRMVLMRLCFCPPEGRGPVELVVQGGTVTSRTYVDGGDPVDPSLAAYFPSVSGLFDLLEEAVDTGADEIQVTWDPETGVPVQLFIDYRVDVADEEQGYRVDEGPEALPAGHPPA